jgi:hypothetical protein
MMPPRPCTLGRYAQCAVDGATPCGTTGVPRREPRSTTASSGTWYRVIVLPLQTMLRSISLPMLACAIICDARATDVRTAVQAGRSSSALPHLHRDWATHHCAGGQQFLCAARAEDLLVGDYGKRVDSTTCNRDVPCKHLSSAIPARLNRPFSRYCAGGYGRTWCGAGQQSRLVSTSDAVQRTYAISTECNVQCTSCNERTTYNVVGTAASASGPDWRTPMYSTYSGGTWHN